MNDETKPQSADDQPIDAPVEPVHPIDPVTASVVPDPARTRWRDRLFGLRTATAVTVAGLILGGIGGFAAGRLTDGGHGDHGDDGRVRSDVGGSQRPGEQHGHRGHPGPPMQLPPADRPEDQPQDLPSEPSSSGGTNS